MSEETRRPDEERMAIQFIRGELRRIESNVHESVKELRKDIDALNARLDQAAHLFAEIREHMRRNTTEPK